MNNQYRNLDFSNMSIEQFVDHLRKTSGELLITPDDEMWKTLQIAAERIEDLSDQLHKEKNRANRRLADACEEYSQGYNEGYDDALSFALDTIKAKQETR